MRGLFAGIPYEWRTRNDIARYEGYYASVFYAWLAAQGLDVAGRREAGRGARTPPQSATGPEPGFGRGALSGAAAAAGRRPPVPAANLD